MEIKDESERPFKIFFRFQFQMFLLFLQVTNDWKREDLKRRLEEK